MLYFDDSSDSFAPQISADVKCSISHRIDILDILLSPNLPKQPSSPLCAPPPKNPSHHGRKALLTTRPRRLATLLRHGRLLQQQRGHAATGPKHDVRRGAEADPAQRLHRHHARAVREDLPDAAERRQGGPAQDVWEPDAAGAAGARHGADALLLRYHGLAGRGRGRCRGDGGVLFHGRAAHGDWRGAGVGVGQHVPVLGV